MTTSVTLQSLTKRFTSAAGFKPGGMGAAVNDVSLHIEAGELFFLLGPSGCGKTTLLRMIAGFIEPTAGTIMFGDPPIDVTRLPPNKRNTGMVFQSYALWPHMTVEANVAFGLSVRKVGPEERNRRVSEALDMVRMGEYAGRKPNQLSGGQQQRVALARALVVRPDVLLLDEPLSNLDAKLRSELRTEIRRICKLAMADSKSEAKRAMTTIYVTHDQKEALGMADRIAVMRGGAVIQVGSPEELYRNPRSPFVAEFMGETNLVDGTVLGAEPRTGFVRVSTPAGDLMARASAPDIETGVLVTCSIRPEAVRTGPLGTKPNGLANVLSGELVDSTYLGDIQQLSIRLKNGALLKVIRLHPIETSISQGSAVAGMIDAADVLAFRRGKNDGAGGSFALS